MKLPNLREGSAPEEQDHAGDDAQNQTRADGREEIGRETKYDRPPPDPGHEITRSTLPPPRHRSELPLSALTTSAFPSGPSPVPSASCHLDGNNAIITAW